MKVMLYFRLGCLEIRPYSDFAIIHGACNLKKHIFVIEKSIRIGGEG